MSAPDRQTGDQEPREETRIDIIRGNPTEEEVAALIAVVTEAYARETDEAVAEVPRISVWQRTRRGIRSPLRRDLPWGRFSG